MGDSELAFAYLVFFAAVYLVSLVLLEVYDLIEYLGGFILDLCFIQKHRINEQQPQPTEEASREAIRTYLTSS